MLEVWGGWRGVDAGFLNSANPVASPRRPAESLGEPRGEAFFFGSWGPFPVSRVRCETLFRVSESGLI
jgi:hypothetical protein